MFIKYKPKPKPPKTYYSFIEKTLKYSTWSTSFLLEGVCVDTMIALHKEQAKGNAGALCL